MGRRKASVNSETETQDPTLQSEGVVEQPENTQTDVDTEAPADGEIPDYADRLLKMYSEYESLYISNKGGVFTVDTPESIRKNAVLYHNKYYNK